MTAQGWGALVATAALLIGLFNFWYSVARVWWREREAKVSARLDLLHYQDHSGWKAEERIVVTNHGPATMRQVEVQPFDEDDQALRTEVRALWPRMPFDMLHADQSIYLTLVRSLADKVPRAVLIRWRDGRRSQQSKWIGLSYNRMT